MNRITHGGSLRALMVATLLTTGLATAWAGTGPNLLVNGSFENGDQSAVRSGDVVLPGSAAITGWTVAFAPVIWGGPGDVGTASDGISFVDLGGGARPQIGQRVHTVAGQAYRLSFDLGTPSRQPNDPGVSVAVGGGAGNYREFHAANDSFAQAYEHVDYEFVAGESVTDVVFSEFNSNEHVDLDNVSLTAMTTSVPEPASWVLLVAGVLGICVVRRHARFRTA